MENIPLLRDIVVLMAVSVPLSMLLSRFGLPTVVGFLLTGVLIGPYGFRLVTDVHTVETLAQIGVVLLLFTIGLEFSISKLLNIRREGIMGGGLQVGLTVLFVLGLALLFGQSLSVALLLGFIISLSSTAIVLKLLSDRGEVSSPQGNFSVGVLIFQDLAVVLMVMVLQSIGLNDGATAFDIAKKLGVSFIAFAVIVAGVVWLMPRLFDQVVKLRNREVFILTIVLVCLGTAWLTSLFGLSLAMGAFIAGLAISESEYSNQIVAVGRVLRYPLKLSIVVGLMLAQIGEFSFILIKMGQGYGLLGRDLYQSLL